MTHPRGRLPARVYWVRRSVVIVVALLLVVGIAHLLGGGGGGTPDRANLSDQTTTRSQHPGPHVTTTTPSGSADSTGGTSAAGAHQGKHTQIAQPLATPSGPCDASQVSATPVVKKAHAGLPITLSIQLSSPAAACTFAVSHKVLAVQVTSGTDHVWSSQDCPRSIPKGSVVVRSAQPAVVPVTWSGRRSNGTCSVANTWALPGYYHVMAAVLGAKVAAGDSQFQLSVPPRPVVTKTAHPKKHSTTPSTPSSTGKSAKHGKGSATKGSATKGKGTPCGGDDACPPSP